MLKKYSTIMEMPSKQYKVGYTNWVVVREAGNLEMVALRALPLRKGSSRPGPQILNWIEGLRLKAPNPKRPYGLGQLRGRF